MKYLLFSVIGLLLVTGCSATWKGVEEDTSNATNWTKAKVNEGATAVKEKTE